MSRLVAKAYHPINDSTEEIWEGFSWPCLFCGFLWYMYKGMWGWGIIALVLALCTFGISWLIFPFFANGQYAKSLLERGYLSEDQWNEKHRVAQTDELAKLAGLKNLGILSDEEFDRQKRKLLSPIRVTTPTFKEPKGRMATSTVILIYIGVIASAGWLFSSGKSNPSRAIQTNQSSTQGEKSNPSASYSEANTDSSNSQKSRLRGNPAHERLQEMSSKERNATLTVMFKQSGEKCGQVTRSFFQGKDKDGHAYWNLECTNGIAFLLTVHNDAQGSTKILECSVLKALNAGECFKKFRDG